MRKTLIWYDERIKI